jgi:hypothetical protein
MVSVLAIVTLLTAGSGLGQSQGPAHPLAGLAGVRVQVDSLPQDVVSDDLWAANLQIATELQLRNGGVRVLVPAEQAATPGHPLLYVHLLVLPARLRDGKPVAFAYCLELQVMERATLARVPQLSTYAVTWTSPRVIGVHDALTLGTAIREQLSQYVARFVTAYHAANPGT